MPIRLIVLLAATLGAFLYITYYNPGEAPLHLGEGIAINLPISVVISASFIAGVVSVMLLYFQDALLDAIQEARQSAFMKKSERARRSYEAGAERLLLERRKEAKKLFKKALSCDGEHVPTLVALGRMEREEGLSLQAIETHAKAKGIDGSNVSNLLELAEDYISAQKLAAALSILNDTRKLMGDSLPLLLRIRDIYVNVHNWEEARTTQQQIIRLAPREKVGEEKKLLAAFIYEKSAGHMDAGELESARRGLRSVVSHDKTFVPAYLKLAEAEDALGWRQDAVRALEKGFKATQSILILKALETLLSAMGETARGLEKLKWAKKLAPGEGVIALFLAETYMREGDLASARREIESVGERLVGMTLFHLIGGKIEQEEDNIDQALEAFNLAYMREGVGIFSFTCNKCNHSTNKYSGRCKACGQWNSLDVRLG